MDKFMEALGARLAGDGALTALVEGGAANITQWRTFERPQEVSGVRIVYQLDGSGDPLGLHGAAVDLVLQLDVWGYRPTTLQDALQAMQRIDELLIRRFELPGGEGGTVRLRALIGWQQAADSDPLTVHWLNRYTTRFWSTGRITELTS